MKKVLVISSSPRKFGNSEILAKSFYQGAVDSSNQVEFISLRDKKINYCKGCYACTKLGRCYQNDDLNEIAKKMEEADVICLATPTYFYSMSGQLKVFIDRLVQNYLKIKADIYIIITAWDPNPSNLNSTLEAIRGFSRDCLENCQEKGVILASGVSSIGDINNKKEYLDKAYKLGKEC